MRMLPLLACLLVPLWVGCDDDVDHPQLVDVDLDRPAPLPEGFSPQPRPAPPTVLPGADRVVALGDVHGDRAAAQAALELAGVVDETGRWVGGRTVVVQLGDQLDRGDDERLLLDWFERLRIEAADAGGGFHPLIGNHEVMNVYGNLAYVTPAGFAAFDDIPGDPPPAWGPVEAHQRGRAVAFAPGGPYARVLGGHNLAQIVGDTVFVHGGLTEAHVEYGLDRFNSEIGAWMRGEIDQPVFINDGTGPLWIRTYGYEPLPEACDALQRTLDRIAARRLVVAHTVQVGVNAACDGRVWRVDVGLSGYYSGPVEALEIIGDDVRVIRQP